MTSSELKALAKQKMEGKTTNLVVITLIYAVIIAACNYIYSPLTLIVGGPFSLGFAIVGLKTLSEEQPEIKDIFSGFYNFGTSLVLYLLNTLFTFLWSLLLIVPGIIKGLSYSMSYYILADHPEISAQEARARSIEMMEGNKMRLFKLHLSFIGWYLLSILTMGILLLWVLPRVQVATAAFYEELSGKDRTDNYSGPTDYTYTEYNGLPTCDDAHEKCEENLCNPYVEDILAEDLYTESKSDKDITIE